MTWFKLYQCIDCAHEADRLASYSGGSYTGRHWLRTWHFRDHKKHTDRTGYTFFEEERFWPALLRHYGLKKQGGSIYGRDVAIANSFKPGDRVLSPSGARATILGPEDSADYEQHRPGPKWVLIEYDGPAQVKGWIGAKWLTKSR